METALLDSPSAAPVVAAGPRPWMPRRVAFTPAALAEPWGEQIRARVEALGLPVEELPRNRVTGLRGESERETYRLGKSTLAVVTAPASQFKLQPIPPSADWQFHLAEGCPAHCQYCYLAGSLQGPPAIRVFANLPAILQNTERFERPGKLTTFEVSCYTDPLGIEHLTGSLAECIRHFGTRPDTQLRWVSKFSASDSLLGLPHHGRARCRASVNAAPVARQWELGVSSVADRLASLRRLALPPEQGGGGYPVGLVIAPIMPLADWEQHYGDLLDQAAEAVGFADDLTFELITHRFTPGSKETLLGWYPNTSLPLDEAERTVKRNKFGGLKYVYDIPTMKRLRAWFEEGIAERFPRGRVLYWT